MVTFDIENSYLNIIHDCLHSIHIHIGVICNDKKQVSLVARQFSTYLRDNDYVEKILVRPHSGCAIIVFKNSSKITICKAGQIDGYKFTAIYADPRIKTDVKPNLIHTE